jgi:hypothetical protein
MQRPENSNLFCCFLAWCLADKIQIVMTLQKVIKE